jgi:hypothetical protein
VVLRWAFTLGTNTGAPKDKEIIYFVPIVLRHKISERFLMIMVALRKVMKGYESALSLFELFVKINYLLLVNFCQ